MRAARLLNNRTRGARFFSQRKHLSNPVRKQLDVRRLWRNAVFPQSRSFATDASEKKEKIEEAQIIEERKFEDTKPFSAEEMDALKGDEKDEEIPDFSSLQHEEEDKKSQAFAEKPDMKVETGQSAHGEAKTHQFKAETKQILDIVANSLYTDKEVFLRELISNASDALEKARYLQSTAKSLVDEEKAFEIRIYTNEKNGTITIQDYGVGMTREELVENLGTIAKSGSKEFLKSIKEKQPSSDVASNIIGQFGVGFYSAFMVGDKVEVFTQAADAASGRATAQYWSSDGSGSYDIRDAESVARGTQIRIHLKEDCKHFATASLIEGIIRKYSNFVGFPIYLNDGKVNTIEAIWTLDKNKVTEEQHREFYKYISNQYGEPAYRLHFKTDVPININALLYFPPRHLEKFGLTRLEPGINLYSRKVLIKSKSKSVLPEWLRFVKGVVDSEDIPLNISRENMQDSDLILKINRALTKRVVKFLEDESRKDPSAYLDWYTEFAQFVKEGVITDQKHRMDAARLLRFESSISVEEDVENKEFKTKTKRYTQSSLDDYISRMPVDQKAIYYLHAPSREYALSSPYYESMKSKGTEVLFCYFPVDHFVMNQMREYNNRKMINLEKSDPSESKDSKQHKELCDWIKKTLSSQVDSVRVSSRLLSSPAIIVDHEPGAIRRAMKAHDTSDMWKNLPKQKLEINPTHPLITKIYQSRTSNPEVASLLLEQVFDNALVSADILDNPRSMLPRLQQILEKYLDRLMVEPKTETQSQSQSQTQETQQS